MRLLQILSDMMARVQWALYASQGGRLDDDESPWEADVGSQSTDEEPENVYPMW